MLGLQDESKLSIPNGNSTTTGFGFVVAEDGDKLRDDLWTIAWIIIGSIVGAVVAAMIAGYFVAQSIVRPIVKLTKLADAMSIGELETPIDIKSRDEIGALGESLERTRLSLKLALERTQRKRTDRSSETTSPR